MPKGVKNLAHPINLTRGYIFSMFLLPHIFMHERCRTTWCKISYHHLPHRFTHNMAKIINDMFYWRKKSNFQVMVCARLLFPHLCCITFKMFIYTHASDSNHQKGQPSDETTISTNQSSWNVFLVYDTDNLNLT